MNLSDQSFPLDPNNPKTPAKPIHYKGVKYLQMIPILLEAIKEQQPGNTIAAKDD